MPRATYSEILWLVTVRDLEAVDETLVTDDGEAAHAKDIVEGAARAELRHQIQGRLVDGQTVELQ